MKTTRLFAALALTFIASGAALAEGSAYDYPQPVRSQTTRAAVVAALMQARANGTLVATEADTQKNPVFVATRSRADVRSETLAAIASGELQALNSDSNAFDPQFRHTAPHALVAAR